MKKKTTARSIMTDSIVSVSPESPLADVLRLFVEEGIHGAPVVDDAGRFVGVISTTDLLRAEQEEQESVLEAHDYLQDLIEFSLPSGLTGGSIDFQDRLAQRTVAEVMTTSFASVPADAPLEAVAGCLRENRIHRVWVVDEDRVCGVVSTLDLMPIVEQLAGAG
jgi:CBS domain-containing protein